MFEIRNLKFKEILNIPYVTINKSITCIVGASGSGKTTFLRMLNRLNAPDEGTIFYNGQDISLIDSVKLRREIVMLGQTPVIYGGTVEENLQIGLQFSQKPPAPIAALKEVLAKVELNKALSDGCRTLSGGERQRLCLARVMLMDAGVYLLDEPSSALDKKTEQCIIENLTQLVLAKNKQLVMISHSEQIAHAFSDSLIRIENGQVAEAYHE